MRSIFTFIILHLLQTAFCQVEQELGFYHLKAVERTIQQEMIDEELVGLSVGIVKDGKIAYLGTHGYMEKSERKKVDLNTEFRWASISKTLTALLVMKLIEKKKLTLDKRIWNHKSWMPYQYNPVTVRQLLSHTSGVAGYDSMSVYYPTWRNNVNSYPKNFGFNARSAANIFINAPLSKRDKGELEYQYSSFGYTLLGAIVNDITSVYYGKGFLQSFDGMVKEPIGATSIKADYIWDSSNYETKGYYKNKNGDIKTRGVKDDVSWKLPGGGFKSNIVDATKFIKAIANKELLSSASYDLMWQKQSNNNYGLGFELDEHDNGDLIVGHGGVQTKTRTQFYVHPTSKTGVIILCNSEWANKTRIAKRIMSAIGIEFSRKPSASYSYNCDQRDKSSYIFSGIWNSERQEQIIRKGYTKVDLKMEIEKLKVRGYRLEDVETHMQGKVRFWDAVFTKSSNKQKSVFDVDLTTFKTKCKHLSDNGYELVDIETYRNNNNRFWYGTFEKKTMNTITIFNQNIKKFREVIESKKATGFHLIDAEYAVINGKRYWTGLFDATFSDSKSHIDISSKVFGQQQTYLKTLGYQLIDIEMSRRKGVDYWTGLWVLGDPDYLSTRGNDFCKFQDKFEQRASSGRSLIDMERRSR